MINGVSEKIIKESYKKMNKENTKRGTQVLEHYKFYVNLWKTEDIFLGAVLQLKEVLKHYGYKLTNDWHETKVIKDGKVLFEYTF